MKKQLRTWGLGALAVLVLVMMILAPLCLFAEMAIPSSASSRLVNIETAVGRTTDSGAVATAVTGTVSVVDYGDRVMRKSVLTLAAMPVVVVEGGTGTNGYGGTKIYDFPAGRILVHGCIVNCAITVDATNLDAADGGDVGCGTAVVSDGDLTDATDIDLCAAIDVDPINGDVHGQLAAAAQFDGTSTAKDMYLNMLIDDADISTSATNTVSGTITLIWSLLGDY